MSSDSTRLPLSVSGTSPLTMRCARPSTMAVLPTPGSPISTGLFLVRRCRIWIVRRISSSRPITGSSLPSRARSVRSIVYFFSASRWPSASCESTPPPPRTVSIAVCSAFRVSPASFSRRPGLALVVGEGQQEELAGDELVAALARLLVGEVEEVVEIARNRDFAALALDLRETARSRRPSACLSLGTATPARERSEAVPPSSCSSIAARRCCGSMKPLSLASALLCASASACWNLVVNLSKRIVGSPRNRLLMAEWGLGRPIQAPAGPAHPCESQFGVQSAPLRLPGSTRRPPEGNNGAPWNRCVNLSRPRPRSGASPPPGSGDGNA